MRPFPPSGAARGAKLLPLAYAGGIFLVLYVFAPFGLAFFSPGALALTAFSYAVITFACLYFSLNLLPMMLPRFFDESSWNVGREIVFSWTNFTLIFAFNYWYGVSEGHFAPGLSGAANGYFFTIAVGAIPFLFTMLIRYNRHLKKNLRVAGEMKSMLSGSAGEEPQEAVIILESGADSLSLDAADLLHIEAQGNYINVSYLRQGIAREKLIRMTLAVAEARLPPGFVKCHRSFIVNMNRVDDFRADGRGLILRMAVTGKDIPVSRARLKEIRSLLRSRS